MKRVRFLVALWTAKLTALGIRLIRRRGSHLPGWVAHLLCPDFLAQLERPSRVIAITGTNGKTTCCNLLADALDKAGYDFVTNAAGSNVDNGIATALLNAATWGGRPTKPLAILEVDERMARVLFPHLRPDIVIVTNLFRDSITRNAHAEFMAYILNLALPEQATLILNADDLISANLGSESNRRILVSVARQTGEPQTTLSLTRDLIVCPRCDHVLAWSFLRHHHIGRAFCPNCGFSSPAPHYEVTTVDVANQQLLVATAGGTTAYHLVHDNIINAYNEVAAIACLREMGLSEQDIQWAFQAVKVTERRVKTTQAGGITITLAAAKGLNAVGVSRVLEYVARAPGKKAVILNLDDLYFARSSSEIITWLYDCDYEYLNDASIQQIGVAGVRCQDHVLRLLIAGVAAEKIRHSRVEVAIAEQMELDGIEQIFILYDVFNLAIAQGIQEQLVARLSGRGRM